MKRSLFSLILCVIGIPQMTLAASPIEGRWRTQDNSKLVEINVFDGLATINTRSFYSNGASVDWFFEYSLPQGRELRVGEVVQGRVRSIDAYYNCVFDEPAQAMMESTGALKVHYPLLTYHRETKSVRDPRGGYYRERRVDWSRWGWVETYYGFPIDRYRVVSSECVVDQRNWITNLLMKTNSPF